MALSFVRREGSRGAGEAGGTAPVFDIVIISADVDDHEYFHRLFGRFGWTMSGAVDCLGAVRLLRRNRAAVAVCDRELADGDWQTLLCANTAVLEEPPSVVVTSRCRNRNLPARVVDSGGFDVLWKPFDKEDALWTIASAWHDWWKRREELPDKGQRRQF